MRAGSEEIPGPARALARAGIPRAPARPCTRGSRAGGAHCACRGRAGAFLAPRCGEAARNAPAPPLPRPGNPRAPQCAGPGRRWGKQPARAGYAVEGRGRQPVGSSREFRPPHPPRRHSNRARGRRPWESRVAPRLRAPGSPRPGFPFMLSRDQQGERGAGKGERGGVRRRALAGTVGVLGEGLAQAGLGGPREGGEGCWGTTKERDFEGHFRSEDGARGALLWIEGAGVREGPPRPQLEASAPVCRFKKERKRKSRTQTPSGT